MKYYAYLTPADFVMLQDGMILCDPSGYKFYPEDFKWLPYDDKYGDYADFCQKLYSGKYPENPKKAEQLAAAEVEKKAVYAWQGVDCDFSQDNECVLVEFEAEDFPGEKVCFDRYNHYCLLKSFSAETLEPLRFFKFSSNYEFGRNFDHENWCYEDNKELEELAWEPYFQVLEVGFCEKKGGNKTYFLPRARRYYSAG